MIYTNKTHSAGRYHRTLANIFFLSVALQLMVACSGLQPGEPDTKTAPLQFQRATVALSALQEMEDIDTLIRLDNHWLGKRFEHVIEARIASGETFSLRNIRTIFLNQIIVIEALIDINDEDGNTISAGLWGDVLLLYRDTGLEWRPRFNELRISSTDFIFAGNNYPAPDPDLTRYPALQAQQGHRPGNCRKRRKHDITEPGSTGRNTGWRRIAGLR